MRIFRQGLGGHHGETVKQQIVLIVVGLTEFLFFFHHLASKRDRHQCADIIIGSEKVGQTMSVFAVLAREGHRGLFAGFRVLEVEGVALRAAIEKAVNHLRFKDFPPDGLHLFDFRVHFVVEQFLILLVGELAFFVSPRAADHAAEVEILVDLIEIDIRLYPGVDFNVRNRDIGCNHFVGLRMFRCADITADAVARRRNVLGQLACILQGLHRGKACEGIFAIQHLSGIVRAAGQIHKFFRQRGSAEQNRYIQPFLFQHLHVLGHHSGGFNQ